MADLKLKKCECGNEVEVKYIAGLGRGILELSKNPFAGGMPTYYICCDKCGKSDFIRLRMQTVTHRDKCKRDLIKRWNNGLKNQ